MEHFAQFYQLNEVINKYKLHLSDVINFWIGHEIPLLLRWRVCHVNYHVLFVMIMICS